MRPTDCMDVEGGGEDKQGQLLASGWTVGPRPGMAKTKGRRELEGVSGAPFRD